MASAPRLSRLLFAKSALTALLILNVAAGHSAEVVSAESAPTDYSDGWYRTVRMGTWLWEGADRTAIEETLGRIAASSGARRWPDRADTIIEYGPGHWVYEFSITGEAADAAGLKAEQRGDSHAARDHFMRASIYYTIASYPHLRDEESRAALAKAFDAYERAGRHLPVPLERWDFEIDGVSFAAFVHLPEGRSASSVPVVLKTGGMDVLSTEFYPLYDTFNELGMAMITFDMPGTGNDGIVNADADRHHVAVIEKAVRDPRFDPERIAVWSASLGGMPAVKVAITQQQHLAAVVNGCGAVHALHAQELGGPPPPDSDIAGLIAAYNAGQLSEAQIAEFNESLSSPEFEAQAQSFQAEAYIDRIRARPDSVLDLMAKSRPVSLKVQGLLGKGVVTDVPILSINTHADPLVPQSESLLVTDASKHGTLMLFGEHDGHCVARTVGNGPIIDWLTDQLR